MKVRKVFHHHPHASLALALVKQIRAEHGFIAVGLTGGVFQNRLWTDYVTALLRAEGFNVYSPERIPGNDAGISFGQIIEVSWEQWLASLTQFSDDFMENGREQPEQAQEPDRSCFE